MNLTYQLKNGVGVVRAHAVRLDAAVAIQFKDRFSEVTGGAASGPERDGIGPEDDIVSAGSAETAETVLLDLSEVEFLDSSGLGAVVAARKHLGADRTLALAGLQPAVEKVMRLTHMDRVFPIYPDAADFLAGQGPSDAA